MNAIDPGLKFLIDLNTIGSGRVTWAGIVSCVFLKQALYLSYPHLPGSNKFEQFFLLITKIGLHTPHMHKLSNQLQVR